MKEIISAIIKIENEAQDVYREAKVIDTDSEKLLEKAVSESRDRSEARIKARLNLKEAECKKQYEARLLEIHAQKNAGIEKLVRDFESGRDDCVERLYNKVLGKQ